jgi:hypothetical protein
LRLHNIGRIFLQKKSRFARLWLFFSDIVFSAYGSGMRFSISAVVSLTFASSGLSHLSLVSIPLFVI